MVSQLPKVKIDGVEYFMDERLKEYRRIDAPFMSRSFSEVRSSDDLVELITLRKEENLGRMQSCIGIGELKELEKVNLDKKSIKKAKKAGICWK